MLAFNVKNVRDVFEGNGLKYMCDVILTKADTNMRGQDIMPFVTKWVHSSCFAHSPSKDLVFQVNWYRHDFMSAKPIDNWSIIVYGSVRDMGNLNYEPPRFPGHKSWNVNPFTTIYQMGTPYSEEVLHNFIDEYEEITNGFDVFTSNNFKGWNVDVSHFIPVNLICKDDEELKMQLSRKFWKYFRYDLRDIFMNYRGIYHSNISRKYKNHRPDRKPDTISVEEPNW
jgi:hypothetical protein